MLATDLDNTYGPVSNSTSSSTRCSAGLRPSRSSPVMASLLQSVVGLIFQTVFLDCDWSQHQKNPHTFLSAASSFASLPCPKPLPLNPCYLTCPFACCLWGIPPLCPELGQNRFSSSSGSLLSIPIFLPSTLPL